MINQQLLDFIKSQLLRNIDKDIITKELIGSGWNEKDINEGFSAINPNVINPIMTSKINSTINPVVSNNFNTKIIITSKKYSLKKKIFIVIFILLCIYGFLELKYLMYTPQLETCIQSDILAQDKNSNNYIKYVECMKGYTITALPDGGYHRVSQRTSGYAIFGKNGNYIYTIPLERHSNNDFRQGTSPDFYFKDKNLFVTVNDNTETNAIPNYNSKLLVFENGKINKIRDISFERQYIIAYENNEIYYLDFEKQTVVREDLLTGKFSIVINLNNLKRDSLYSNIYSLCSYRDKNKPMTSFSIVESFDEKTRHQIEKYYSLDLNSGKLLEITWNGDYIIHNHCQSLNLELYPNRVKYSKIEGNASTYNLKYDPNPQMDIYRLLMILKKGISAGLPRVIG